jgi:hypothetical protein
MEAITDLHSGNQWLQSWQIMAKPRPIAGAANGRREAGGDQAFSENGVKLVWMS